MIKTLSTKNFVDGFINAIESRSIKRGAMSDGINWEAIGDGLRLRYGYSVLGTYQTATGKINGLCTAVKENGDEIYFRARALKLEYSTDKTTWTEIGTNLLYNEDTSIENYVSQAGRFVYVNSPNLGHIYKIDIYHPADTTDVYVGGTTNYCGYMKIVGDAMWVWGVLSSPQTLFRSCRDARNYQAITGESMGTGNGGKTYSGTLAFKAGGARRTCFGLNAVKDEDSIETFTDNRDGTLKGSAGGTGTINYTTGAFTLTFNANVGVGKAITGSYLYIDDAWFSTPKGGIANFCYSATRVAMEGNFFLQQTGGKISSINSFDNDIYVRHEKNWYKVTQTADDTSFTNLVFRDNLGSPSFRGSFATGDGIYSVYQTDTGAPQFGIISYQDNTTRLEPKSLSEKIEVNNYLFDKAVVYEWGDYVFFCGRESNSTENNVMFVWDKKWHNWKTMFNVSANCFEIFDGTLVIGDSVSQNTFQMFDGFADYTSDITNYVELSDDNLDEESLKRLYNLRLTGEISKDQSCKVYANIDNGGWVELGTISGSGDYVDFGQAITIGSQLVGAGKIGGSDNSATVYKFDYMLKDIQKKIDKFEYIKLKFEAQGAGYIKISEYAFWDYRIKEKKQPIKYRNI